MTPCLFRSCQFKLVRVLYEVQPRREDSYKCNAVAIQLHCDTSSAHRKLQRTVQSKRMGGQPRASQKRDQEGGGVVVKGERRT